MGGGCCPSGYGCGTASCSALGGATATASSVTKQNESSHLGAYGGTIALAFGVLALGFIQW